MSEKTGALKEWINPQLLKNIALEIKKNDPSFQTKLLTQLSKELRRHELKARVQLVRERIFELLGKDYLRSLDILVKTSRSPKLNGFDLWPLSDFIQTYGLDHPSDSLKALQEMTEKFSSEFAVRPFLIAHTDLTLRVLQKAAISKNVHHRRWASEGCRPRLPWGQKLGLFVNNPKPVIQILDQLKNDSELYVRKSVANNLNDISKDHPELVIQTLRKWKKSSSSLSSADASSPTIDWITRHALRTLIKKGNPNALKLVGVDTSIKVKCSPLLLSSSTVKVGQEIAVKFTVKSQAKKPEKAVIDYLVYYQKANKSLSPKVFKLKTLTIGPSEVVQISKKLTFKRITTRKYYSGKHLIEVQINGKKYSQKEFYLHDV